MRSQSNRPKFAFVAGRAAHFAQGGRVFVVVMRLPAPFVVSGPWTEDLLLLDDQGRLSDRGQCTIISRLLGRRDLSCDCLNEPKRDGATIVVRFAPVVANDSLLNFDHELSADGEKHRFSWNGGYDAWKRRRLCHLVITVNRFQILRQFVPRKTPVD